MNNTSVKTTRRDILKGSIATCAGLFASSLVYANPETKIPEKWDESTDIIVVGTGFAGLSAAIAAKKEGANVIVLEKMPAIGGNSVIDAGDMCAVGTEQQKAKNVKDSAELLAQDMLRNGLFRLFVHKCG